MVKSPSPTGLTVGHGAVLVVPWLADWVIFFGLWHHVTTTPPYVILYRQAIEIDESTVAEPGSVPSVFSLCQKMALNVKDRIRGGN
jgi:hypothetical protein